jgi:hypothetical protein
MVKLVMSSLVINAMNAIAEEEMEMTNGNQGILEVGNDQQSTDKEGEGEGETPSESLEEIRPEVQQQIPTETPPDSLEQSEEEQQEPAQDDVGAESTITTRSGRGIKRPTRYLAVTKLSKQDWKENEADRQ